MVYGPKLDRQTYRNLMERAKAMIFILHNVGRDQMDNIEFPGRGLVEDARVSVYCLGGHVITGVVKKTSTQSIEIDRDGTDYIIRNSNIVAYSINRNDK